MGSFQRDESFSKRFQLKFDDKFERCERFTWKSAISSRGIKGRRRQTLRPIYLLDAIPDFFFRAKNIKERPMKLQNTRSLSFESMSRVPRSCELLHGTIYQDHRKIKEKNLQMLDINEFNESLDFRRIVDEILIYIY